MILTCSIGNVELWSVKVDPKKCTIDGLYLLLDSALACEDFEDAATIRDEINFRQKDKNQQP